MGTKSWDIFCTVVDNYGDIGACWRLARQLAGEHGQSVRLWTDDLQAWSHLCPQADPGKDAQRIEGVEVRRWSRPFPAVDIPDVVIEAFACELPAAYLKAMAARSTAPLWINLEYLSAEAWVEGCHGMVSPHPRLPLSKRFFFPGFTPATGGLLRERDYGRRRAAFDAAAFRRRLGLPAAQDGELTLSLFAYENPALPDLLESWAVGGTAVRCLVPEGRVLAEVGKFFGTAGCRPGEHFRRGRLNLHILPFLPQPDYDGLLWLCELNFMRGEDSFARAQWAEKPFVWHIYPQADAAHLAKLEAFLDRYLATLPPAAIKATRDFWLAWNGRGDIVSCWPAFLSALPALNRHAGTWARQIAGCGDLAGKLLSFAEKPLAMDGKGR